MSMDDVHVRAENLSRALEQFNGQLGAAMADVDRAHTQVNGLWDDSMRRDYDRRWLPLKEGMENYNQKIGPQYMAFLVERLRRLNSYLYGYGA